MFEFSSLDRNAPQCVIIGNEIDPALLSLTEGASFAFGLELAIRCFACDDVGRDEGWVTMNRQRRILLTTLCVVLSLSSCTNQGGTGSSGERQATIVMQDGTKVTGTVKASSPSEITLVGNDHVTRTIPMDQVKSVDYSAVPNGVSKASGGGQSNSAASPAKTFDLPAGTEIPVLTDEAVDSGQAAEGQSFAAEVRKDVLESSGAVAIPHGSGAQLVILSASKGGRIRGASDLSITLASVTVGGQNYEVDTGKVERVGKPGMGKNKRTAEFTGGGAGIGAIIGAIAGGGKGAAIGAGAGAGAGALTQILTKGKAVQIPAESVLTFMLDKPLRIVATD